MVRSRSLKTTMREYVDGDFIYVDVDTLWVNPIDESDFYTDVMGVPDAHVELLNHPCYDYIKKEHSKLGFDLKGRFYLNGGVLYLKDSDVAHDFMNEWNKYWKYSCEKGVPTDQKSLNYVASEKKYSVGPLPDCYNVQISYTIRHLLNAKLIHYFGSKQQRFEEDIFFELQKKSFWEQIKKIDDLPSFFKKIVRTPWESFVNAPITLNQSGKRINNPVCGFVDDLIMSKKTTAKFLLKCLNATTRLISKIYSFLTKIL